MKIIDDFITLIKHLVKKEENVMIAEINTKIENNITPEFLQIFNGQKYLELNKTSKLFKCFLKLIFNDIKEEIEEYSTENIDKNTEKNLEDDLNSYFEVKEDDDDDKIIIMIIKKMTKK